MALGQTTIQFALAGLNRGLAFQSQPPYSTPRAINVRPRGPITARRRGGSRPGLAKAFASSLPLSATAAPIRLLDSVQTYRADTSRNYSETFAVNGTLGGASYPDWSSSTALGTLPNASDGIVSAIAAQGAMLTDLNPDPTRPVVVTITDAVMNVDLGGYDRSIYAYAMFKPTTPFDCVSARIKAQLFGSLTSFDLQVQVTVGGVVVASASHVWSAVALTATHDLVLTIGGGNVKADWGDAHCSTATPSLPAYDRFAFALYGTTGTAEDPIHISGFSVNYTTAADLLTRPRCVIASAGGKLAYASTANVLTAASYDSSVDLGSPLPIQSAENFGKLYIADFSIYRATGSKGITSTATFTDSDMTTAHWTPVAAVGDWLWIYNAATATEGVYRITNVVSGALTLESSPGDESTGTILWRVIRGPKIFDPNPPSGHQLIEWAPLVTAGSLPAACPLICSWNSRMVMAGGPVFPYAWWMSRFGDPLDWDYNADPGDPGRAFYSQAGEKNIINQPITALVPFTDDYLMFGLENSLYILRGDPGLGGTMGCLSRSVGIIGSRAFCYTPEGQVVFMARGGIYVTDPGGGTYPQPLSRAPLPAEMRDIDTTQITVQLAMDVRDLGVHIFITPNAGGSGQHWWMDWQDGGFWPVTYPDGMDPTSATLAKDTGSGVSDVLLGCRDGYIRHHLDGAETDDSSSLGSEVVLGPIMLNGQGLRGIVQKIEGILSATAGTVYWEIYADDSPEAAFNRIPTSPNARGTWGSGVNYSSYPRVLGACCFIRLASTSAWELENCSVAIVEAGRVRKM